MYKMHSFFVFMNAFIYIADLCMNINSPGNLVFISLQSSIFLSLVFVGFVYKSAVAFQVGIQAGGAECAQFTLAQQESSCLGPKPLTSTVATICKTAFTLSICKNEQVISNLFEKPTLWNHFKYIQKLTNINDFKMLVILSTQVFCHNTVHFCLKTYPAIHWLSTCNIFLNFHLIDHYLCSSSLFSVIWMDGVSQIVYWLFMHGIMTREVLWQPMRTRTYSISQR